MATLEQQFESFKESNPWAAEMDFETWKGSILAPKLKRMYEEFKKLNEDESDTTHDNIQQGDIRKECSEPD